MSSYVSRDLRLEITLATGEFGSSKGNKITLQGWRALCNISSAGGAQLSQADVSIFGLKSDLMKQLTRLQKDLSFVERNRLDIFAINGGVETLVFAGEIWNAWADYTKVPDVCLRVSAMSGFYSLIKPESMTSYKGPTDVVDIAQQLATLMRVGFENGFIGSGVKITIENTYLSGSAVDRLRDLVKMTGMTAIVELGVLYISPLNTPRAKNAIIEINRNSGLVGYPVFDAASCIFMSEFNPAIRFNGLVHVTSDAETRDGNYIVQSLSHQLEAQMPDGKWFSTVVAATYNASLSS